MQTINNKFKSFLLFFIIVLTSFWLWLISAVFLPFYKNLSQENTPFIDTIKEQLWKKDLNLDLFWQAYNLIGENFYSSWSVSKTELEYGMIQGLVWALGDKFSEFMIPEDTKVFENALSWDFEWIGAVIIQNALWVEVDRILKWSPALDMWILKWDIIIEADGLSLEWMTPTEAVNHIKWPAGTQVSLKILRSGESDFITKEVTRRNIKIPSVDTLDIEDDEIGYISLNIFWENTSQEFKEMLQTFEDDKIKWIIIDLRDNWGWYLQSAVEILSNFIERWKVLVTTKYKNTLLNTEYHSQNRQKVFNKKIVVLINGNSASASEITAWALKDYNKAILVGEKSYWKWSVQQPFDFKDGSMLKLTIARWYTPKDYSIDHNGIEPDIEVHFERQDYEDRYDRQLEVAKQILKKYIKLDSISLVIHEYEKEVLENINSQSDEQENLEEE